MKASVDKIKEFMKDHSMVHIFIIDKVTVPSFDVLNPYRKHIIKDYADECCDECCDCSDEEYPGSPE